MRATQSQSAGAVVRRIGRNFSWLALGQLAFRLSYLLLLAVLARSVSLEEYAAATVIFIFCGLATPIYNFGLGIIGIREVAKGNLTPGQFISYVLPLKLLLSVAGFGFIVVAGIGLGYGRVSNELLLLLAGSAIVISIGEFYHIPFTALERMQVTARLIVFERGVTSLLAVSALVIGLGVVGFGWGYFAGAIIGALLAARVGNAHFGPIRLKLHWATLLTYTKESWPVAANMLFIVAYGRLGVIILESVGSKTDVAYFNTAYLLVYALQMGVTTVMQAIYPMMSRAHGKHDKRVEANIERLITIGLPIIIGLIPIINVVLEWLVPIIFGANYSPTTYMCSLLLWAIPFFVVNTGTSYYLRAAGAQSVMAIATGVGLAVNIIANLLLVGRFGATGVAIAAVGSEMIIFVVLAWVAGHQRKVYASARSFGLTVLSVLAVAASVLATGGVVGNNAKALAAVAYCGMAIIAFSPILFGVERRVQINR